MQFLLDDKPLGMMGLLLRRPCEYAKWNNAEDTPGRLRVSTLGFSGVLHLVLMALVTPNENPEFKVEL